MQKKSKNVVHSQDGIKRKKLKNSRPFRNSPPPVFSSQLCRRAALIATPDGASVSSMTRYHTLLSYKCCARIAQEPRLATRSTCIIMRR
jgi:hypothetical protein